MHAARAAAGSVLPFDDDLPPLTRHSAFSSVSVSSAMHTATLCCLRSPPAVYTNA